MHSFQSFLKSVRESKDLEQKTVADAINLSIETIEIIEESDNETLLQNSSSLLKNQIRRYCEYLEIPEKKIISMLNKLDVLYYKKSRYGKLKFFDYVNRFAIFVIAIVIIVLVAKHIKENAYLESSKANSKGSEQAIIYTPINYEMNNSGEQQSQSSNELTKAKGVINKTDISSSTHNKGLTAHPPATANMNNIVINEPETTNKKNTSQT